MLSSLFRHKCAPARNREAVSRECGGEAAALLFFRRSQKKRRARAMHYHSGCGVLLGGKERRGIESRRCAASIGAANALPLGGFCCPGNISHPAKRRRNTLWLNSRRACSSAAGSSARLRRSLPAHPPIKNGCMNLIGPYSRSLFFLSLS